jgi:hypothetical protein
VDDGRFRILQLSQEGYYCSQILMALFLEAQGKRDVDLIRAMAGLGLGAGSPSGTCGALSGAACVLGLYAGRGDEGDGEDAVLGSMLAELWDWFENEGAARYGGVSCGHILEGGEPRPQRCGSIVVDTYAKLLEILAAHDLEPTEPRDA